MFMFSLQTSPPLSVYKQCFTRVFRRFEKLKDKMFSVVFPDFFSIKNDTLGQQMYKRVSVSVRVNVVMRVRVRVIVRVSVGGNIGSV